MEQLWIAVEEYYILPANELSQDNISEHTPITYEAYSIEMQRVLADIQAEQIALDNAHIDIQSQRQIIQQSLRRARSATKKYVNKPNEVRDAFASVFRTFAPNCAKMFNVLLQRKHLSRVSVIAKF